MDNPLPISLPPEKQTLIPVFAPILIENIEQIPDKDLLALCNKYGREAILWRKKFIGLLPEVNRRRLYEKENFQSIYHFAAVSAGVSKDQVDRVLGLYKTFEDKPDLKKVLVEGTASISKLSRITKIATRKNQAYLAVQAQTNSRKVLETIAKDEIEARARAREENQLFKEKPKLNFELPDEVIAELNRLHKIDKDVGKLLQEFFDQKNKEIEQKEQELSTRAREETHLPSRNYYKKAIRDFLHEKYGTKCAIHGCTKPAEEIHHKIRFGLQANNDPAYLVPLCAEHHKIAHSIDIQVTEHWEK
ncbi:MAG: HNH endonuclease signature motif containing protein [Candidatus Gracilibacteria bacterium]|jgi:hypothetical protein